jgi:hypothetical protein
LELWSRIEGVPAVDGIQWFPALEIFADGRVRATRNLHGRRRRALRYPAKRVRRKFDVKLNLRDGISRLPPASTEIPR